MSEQKKNTTRSSLSDTILMYTTKGEDPLSFSYEVECTTLKTVRLTLNFEGSENFMIVGQPHSELAVTTVIRPFTRHLVCKIQLINEDKRATLKMGCEWEMEEPNKAEVDKYMKAHEFEMSKILRDAETLNFPPSADDPDNQGVIQITSQYGKGFVDLEFPPVEKSLYKAQDSATSKKTAIEWKRPRDFFTGDYQVFSGGIEPGDIRQGALGDCWFLCAIAALTEFPVLVQELFPEDSKVSNNSGVYHVRFCKNGLWTTVRLDDFFPCFPGGGPIYSRSNGNELWVLLLEKAFAKVCGSYEAIKAGWAYEAMIDLTGAPYKIIRLDDTEVKATIESGALWASLLKYDLENFLMSASTPGEDEFSDSGSRPKDATGLVAGHAYTLISVKQSKKGDKLVKLRNPWGSMEWGGDWSDTSPLWTAEMQAEIEPLVKTDDGTFWMSFQDMLKYFYSINVSLVRRAGLNKAPWHEQRRRFVYDYNNDEETTENLRVTCPNYIMNVAKPGKFYASVHQEDIRCAGAKSYIDVGVSVLKVDPVYGTFTLMSGSGNTVDRQNQTEEFDLPAGKYVVVPTSTGCKLQRALAKYHEDFAAARAANPGRPLPEVVRTNAAGEIEFTQDVHRVYGEIFGRCDLDGDGFLCKAELDQYMVRTEGSTIDEKAYLWLLHNFESREAKGLTLAGFIRAQEFVFKQTGADEEKLRKEFCLLGYDDYLQYASGRSAVLVLHGTTDFTLDANTFDEKAYREAIVLPIINQGERSQFEEGKINLFKYRSGYYGLSFVVENKHTFPLVFILDCTESTNVISHRGSLSHQETVPPGESRVMHHLLPGDNEAAGWSWAYSASYMWDDETEEGDDA